MTIAECSVLIVDPDVFSRRLIADFLTDIGCAAEFFDDGYSALDQARRHPPVLVITDILIPKLDGLALCRLLKGDPALEGTKIMVLSILAAEKRARQAGADGFLKKPLERRALAAAIRSLIPSNSENSG